MKIVTVLVVFVMMVFIGGRMAGQNLVPNYSFEDTVACPDGANGEDHVPYATGWENWYCTPDYFNTCSTNGFSEVPYSLGAANFQIPRTGNAYVGLFARWPNASWSGGPNIRDYIGVHLTSPMQVGVKYFFTMYVSLAVWAIAPCCSNNLGVKFTTQDYSAYGDVCLTSSPLLDNSAVIYTDTMITDTANWVKLSGSYIADQAYEYLAIGNFFDDAHTDTLIMGPQIYCYAYYFIDDVYLSTDSLASGTETLNSQPILSLSPNPVQNFLTINFLSPSALASGESIAVYDVAGRKIVLPTTFANNKAELTTTTLPNGIYLVQIINRKTGMSEVGKFVKE